LIFALTREDGEESVERMWVEVIEADPYVGVLQNQPNLEGVIAHGDRVEFRPEHVCGYAYSEDELGYNVDARCFLLRRIAEADAPTPERRGRMGTARPRRVRCRAQRPRDRLRLVARLPPRPLPGDRGPSPRRLNSSGPPPPPATRRVVGMARRSLRQGETHAVD